MKRIRKLTDDEVDAFAGLAARIQVVTQAAQAEIEALRQKHSVLAASIEAEGGTIEQTPDGLYLCAPEKKKRKKKGKR